MNKKFLHTRNIILLIGILAGVAVLAWVVMQFSSDELESESAIAEPQVIDDEISPTPAGQVEIDTEEVPMVEEVEPLTTVVPEDNPESEASSDFRVHEDSIGKFAISYPQDWSVVSGKSEPDSLQSVWFVAPGEELSILYPGEIMIVIRENPEDLPLEQYYEQSFAINLFSETDKVKETEVAGVPGKWFSAVRGLTPSEVVAIVHDGQVIEFHDIATTHQEDNVFTEMLNSLQFL
ncbi:hypothetical protein ACFL2B_00560 [Patescibacteria group bacterium]